MKGHKKRTILQKMQALLMAVDCISTMVPCLKNERRRRVDDAILSTYYMHPTWDDSLHFWGRFTLKVRLFLALSRQAWTQVDYLSLLKLQMLKWKVVLPTPNFTSVEFRPCFLSGLSCNSSLIIHSFTHSFTPSFIRLC